MKPLLTIVCLGLGLTSWGQEATNEVAQPRPVYRYLFLVDTSSAMSRQKGLTMDTVSRLILSGIGSRIHTGEFWNIWTFDDQLHTNAFPAQMWDLHERPDVADRAYRFLRDQRFNRKKEPLDKPLAAIAEEAKLSGALTAFVFTDGSAPVKGTPFDEPINDIFTKHASGMRKAKRPFVIVMVAEEGQFTAQAVSPAGEPIYIPRGPKAAATAKASEAANHFASPPSKTGTKPPADATDTAATVLPPKKPLTVEEIAAVLRQSKEKQTNKVAAASAPAILLEATSNSVASTQPRSPNVPPAESAPHPPPPQTPNPDKSSPQDGSEIVSNTVAVSSPAQAAPAVSVQSAESAPAARNGPTRAETIVTPAPDKNEGARAAPKIAAKDADAIAAADSASPQTALILQPAPASNSGKYLAAAVALLLVALTLAWLYIRTIRYVPRPSLISRSVEKEKMKSE